MIALFEYSGSLAWHQEAISRPRSTVLEQRSHRGLVAVGAQNTLFWSTVIISMSKFFTTIMFRDFFSFEIITKVL